MRNAIVFALNLKLVEMRIAPPHGDLNGVVEIGRHCASAGDAKSSG
jgi:hypothetical protein